MPKQTSTHSYYSVFHILLFSYYHVILVYNKLVKSVIIKLVFPKWRRWNKPTTFFSGVANFHSRAALIHWTIPFHQESSRIWFHQENLVVLFRWWWVVTLNRFLIVAFLENRQKESFNFLHSARIKPSLRCIADFFNKILHYNLREL